MVTFEATIQELQQLLETSRVGAAERIIDALAEEDAEALAGYWNMSKSAVEHCISIFYNNVGANHHGLGREALRQQQWADSIQAAKDAERCHEKALDMYDMSAEDIMFFPSNHPIIKNFIMTFWGLAISKHVLGKSEESKKYLELCLRLPAEDDQARAWQQQAYSLINGQ